MCYIEGAPLKSMIRKEVSKKGNEEVSTFSSIQLIDYTERPKELESTRFYYFIRCYKKVKINKQKNNFNYKFTNTHRQYEIHAISIRETFVIPLVYGPLSDNRFPSNEIGETAKEKYARCVMLLYFPFRQTSDILNSEKKAYPNYTRWNIPSTSLRKLEFHQQYQLSKEANTLYQENMSLQQQLDETLNEEEEEAEGETPIADTKTANYISARSISDLLEVIEQRQQKTVQSLQNSNRALKPYTKELRNEKSFTLTDVRKFRQTIKMEMAISTHVG